MTATLRVLLAALGASAILICLSIVLAGPGATAGASEAAFDALTGWRGPATPPWPPSMDSELRFYAPFWGAYGALLILTAARLEAWRRLVPWLAALFFAGGVGRAISAIAVGPPHPFFQLLMAVELATPPVLVLLWLGAARRREPG